MPLQTRDSPGSSLSLPPFSLPPPRSVQTAALLHTGSLTRPGRGPSRTRTGPGPGVGTRAARVRGGGNRARPARQTCRRAAAGRGARCPPPGSGRPAPGRRARGRPAGPRPSPPLREPNPARLGPSATESTGRRPPVFSCRGSAARRVPARAVPPRGGSSTGGPGGVGRGTSRRDSDSESPETRSSSWAAAPSRSSIVRIEGRRAGPSSHHTCHTS